MGIGSEPAKVRVTHVPSDAGGAGASLTAVNSLLEQMDVEAMATIRSFGSGPDDPPVIDIQGVDAGLLIGRRGETLQALQFMVNMMMSHERGEWSNVAIDIERYRERRETSLRSQAQRMATRVAANGSPMTMEPMSAADRRIVHMALADHGRVTTQSSGEGSDRRVTIRVRED